MKNIKKSKATELTMSLHRAYIGCTFKRTQDGQWEQGLAILKPENIGVSHIEKILDMDDKIVESVWNYELDKTSTITENHLVI